MGHIPRTANYRGSPSAALPQTQSVFFPMARRAAPRIVVETEGSNLSSTDVADVRLRARPGDRIVIRPHRLGEHPHDGEILDVLGEDGGPPYLVRWSDDGHVSRLFPGPDAFVEHFAPHPGKHGLRGSRAVERKR